jgi:transposase InsO family protein
MAIDHQDHDRDNNAIVNLRLATPIQNIWNQLITVNTGVTKRGRYWLAAITNFGKRYYLGWFLNVEEARSAYHKAVIDTRGVFACVEIKDK